MVTINSHMILLTQNQEDIPKAHDNPPPVVDVTTSGQPHHVGHAQRQPKWSHDHKGQRGQHKKSPHTTDKSSHGDDTQRGRVNKERHKGSRANHNRKDRAQQKMRKGMF